MNRIKFKAWHKEEKRWATHDELLSDVPVSATVREKAITVGSDDWELIMYTGLNDIDGVEIYEGSIIQRFNKGSGENEIGLVESEIAYFQVAWSKGDYEWEWEQFLFELEDCEDLKVIGHIYDNPELINHE